MKQDLPINVPLVFFLFYSKFPLYPYSIAIKIEGSFYLCELQIPYRVLISE